MTLNRTPFHDEASLGDTAEALGKQAMELGIIPSFVVRFFPDGRQFYIPDEHRSEPLTAEQAYMRLKSLVDRANQ